MAYVLSVVSTKLCQSSTFISRFQQLFFFCQDNGHASVGHHKYLFDYGFRSYACISFPINHPLHHKNLLLSSITWRLSSYYVNIDPSS